MRFCLISQVRNREEYDFHPAHTVRQICQIYVNLRESDSFCLAVSQDGRSYSHSLFTFAEQTLGEKLFAFEFSDQSSRTHLFHRKNE